MRAIATIGSFFVLLGLYYLYGWVAVPLVLPEVVDISLPPPPEDTTREELGPYLALLPKDSWERNPEIKLHYLRFNETILLFGQDEPNGKIVRLEPCTVLMIPGIDDTSLDDEQLRDRIRQAVILRTPQYAEIEFNREFSIQQVSSLEIAGGRLFGKVIIESDMKETGPGDDIYLETEDVSISMTNPALTQIATIKDVRFRVGCHGGEGSMLNMELAASNPKNPKSTKELSRLQFEKLKRLSLVFPEDTTRTPKVVADHSPNALQGRRIIPEGPATLLNITCQRQFSFFSQKTTQSWIARFLGNVEIARTTPDGETDLLHADEVFVDFQPPKPVAPAKDKPAPVAKSTSPLPENTLGKLEPVLFKALGRLAQGNQPAIPARLTTKRNGGVVMLGDQFLYDLRKNCLTLETQTAAGASQEVEIVLENRYHIRGQKGFEYVMGANGEFGRLVSLGPGSLTGDMGKDGTPKNLFLSWDFMQIVPDPEKKDQIILKLWDRVAASMEGFGQMRAGKLDLWCRMAPKEKSATKTPDPAASKNAQATLPGLGEDRPSSPSSMVSGNNGVKPVYGVLSNKVCFENESGVCNVNHLDLVFSSEGINVGAYPAGSTAPTQLARLKPRTPRIESDSAVVQVPSVSNGHGNPVQWVQHVQEGTSRDSVITAAPQVPLYEARPNAPVANQVRPSPVPVPTSVASQNLFGLQTSNSPARYEIDGDRMRMKIIETENDQSRVEAIVIEGNVRIVESLLDKTRGDIIEVTGEEIRVWNPSTPETQVRIQGVPGRDAEFKGRGVRMIAKEINIYRPENKIWSEGMGRLIVNADKTDGFVASRNPSANRSTPAGPVASQSNPALLPLKPLASSVPPPAGNSPLVVEWNKTMVFDGKTFIFEGAADKNGNRVRTIFQDKSIWCNVMKIHLNRLVQFFEKDDSGVAPEAETVHCAHDVRVLVREKDEAGQLKSINEGHFESLIYQVKMNYFVATAQGRGMLRRTFLSNGKGFADSKVNLPGTISPSTAGKVRNEDGLNFCSVWFQQEIRGTLQPGGMDVEISDWVDTVYCPVESWDDVIRFENIKAARRLGYILECEKMRIVQMPDPLDPKVGTLELTAEGDAKIDGSRFYGKGRKIKYVQAKDLVTFEGNAEIHASGEKGEKSKFAADAIEYNIENGAYNVRQSSGVIIGQ